VAFCGTRFCTINCISQGFVWIDGIGWNGIVWNVIPLFGYFKNEWNGVVYDGIHSIPFHSLLSFFFPSNLGGIGWNATS